MRRSRRFAPSAGSVRAVIDTNVLVSGKLWHGAPHALLDRVRTGAVTLVSSTTQIAAFAAVIRRPNFAVILDRSGADPC